jgi:hypothetical protein
MPTRDEIENLKLNWKRDPCWDLWTTEGFEEHEEELKAFQEEQAAEWAQRARERLFEKSVDLGVPGNILLALAFDRLETRIKSLEEALEKL